MANFNIIKYYDNNNSNDDNNINNNNNIYNTQDMIFISVTGKLQFNQILLITIEECWSQE